MPCLSFGYWIVLLILYAIISSAVGMPRMVNSLVTLGLFVWFVVGFLPFVQCD